MHTILAVTRKELRAYFNSTIAYVFLIVFAGAGLARFFHQVWVIDQATLRPLLEVLPLLLLVLVPALTMRLWSEERKLGTLEVLLTMPVRGGEVVLGKFLASLILLAIGLMLTFGAPVTMAMLGPLDWGPVIGGYLAALLVGAAYLAIGLMVSSLTENQILAFLGALLICFALWIVGEEVFLKLWPQNVAAVLERIGTGARFESVARGVVDLRDMAYYGSLIALCLAGNTVALEARREG